MTRQPWPFPPEWAVAWGGDELSPFPFVEAELAPGVTTRLRWIPPGRFLMGSPEGEAERLRDEGPQHWVTLTRGFWLGETACTQREWEAVMGENPSRFKDEPQSPEHPVEQVSWEDCAEFLKRAQQGDSRLDLRLPTEAEWEYACRAKLARGDEYESVPFSFGATITTEQVNYDGDPYGRSPRGECREKTVPVRSLPPNQWGLYEMHGNVWEWCRDWKREYAAEEQCDPVGPEMGRDRVLRGGSWYVGAGDCRSAQRGGHSPDGRWYFLGFRLLAVQPG